MEDSSNGGVPRRTKRLKDSNDASSESDLKAVRPPSPKRNKKKETNKTVISDSDSHVDKPSSSKRKTKKAGKGKDASKLPSGKSKSKRSVAQNKNKRTSTKKKKKKKSKREQAQLIRRNQPQRQARFKQNDVDLRACAIKTHAEIAKIWPNSDDSKVPPIEPVESCILVTDFYCKWAGPRPIKLLIMAESHAATDQHALGAPIVVAPSSGNFGNLESIHPGHVNLVHCPSYGEPWLLGDNVLNKLSKSSLRGMRSGTKQFWRVLASAAGECDMTEEQDEDPLTEANLKNTFAHIEGSKKKHRETRLANKIAILEKLKARGIHLADVCPVPIYKGGSTVTRFNKTTGNKYTTKVNAMTKRDKKVVIRTAWHNYGQPLIEHCRPEKLLILGKEVAEAIGEDALEKSNCQYLGYMNHPSWNRNLGKNLIPTLKRMRTLGKEAEQAA